MKKSKKIKILKSSCGTYDFCRILFKYTYNWTYYYILDHNEYLCFNAREDDFILNGFEINRLSDIKDIAIMSNATIDINKRRGLLNGLEIPEINISSWKTVFEFLAKTDFYVIVQNEYRGFFRIGKIKKVKKSSVIFKSFDGCGVWQHKIKIPFSDITTVQFGDRYSNVWKEYMESDKFKK